MIYVVTDEYRSDTIKVFMPYKPEEVKQDLRAKGKTVEKKKDIKTGKTVSALNNANAPLVIAPGDSSRISGNSIAKAVNANSGRNECKTNASQNDFIKLRKEMAAQDGDEEMIAIARKTFRIKCFSSEQVKNLSVLFLKDEGKYNFLDAAYLHVNDESNFSQLESLLTDAYYLNRFRAMLRH